MMMLGRFELVFDFLICILRAGAALGSFFSQTSLRAKGDAFFFLAWRVIVYWHGIGEQQRTGCSFLNKTTT
jgi:hypothetical protein